MRSILLTKHVENLATTYARDLFIHRQANFVQPKVGLTRILIALPTVVPALHSDYTTYIRNIQRVYRLLNALKPNQYNRLHQLCFQGLAVDLSLVMTINGIRQQFYKHIANALRYDAVRDEDFLPFAKKLGIRSCVYCNANYAYSIQVNGKDAGKYELDHHWSQAEYPYLCTNFYNLNPVCSSCNKAKSDNRISFSLYTVDPTQVNPFGFSLDKRSVIRYMLSQDYEDLKIIFDPARHAGHDTTFKIDAIYETLKDVAEELVWKHKAYNPSYLKSLSDAFNKKFSNGGLNRLLLGNYDRPADIHKRPLSKMAQDIARQLGVIK